MSELALYRKYRPGKFAEVVGQEHLTGPEGAIGRMVAAGRLSSMILWGPPGTGKTTTLGVLVAEYLDRHPGAKVLLLSTTN